MPHAVVRSKDCCTCFTQMLDSTTHQRYRRVNTTHVHLYSLTDFVAIYIGSTGCAAQFFLIFIVNKFCFHRQRPISPPSKNIETLHLSLALSLSLSRSLPLPSNPPNPPPHLFLSLSLSLSLLFSSLLFSSLLSLSLALSPSLERECYLLVLDSVTSTPFLLLARALTL
jgi:hypothetical protein